MRAFSPNTVALALILLALVAPTGAVMGDDITNDGGGVVLSPHSGPNGKYATLDGNGNLSIDLGDDLNPDAVTTFEGVFNVTNDGPDDVRVWIDHDAEQYVEFRTVRSGSIEGSGTVLSAGETVSVSVTVDTDGAAPGDRLIDEIEVHAARVGGTTAPTSTGSGSGDSGSSGGLRSAPTGTPDERSDRTIVGTGTVRIAFDRGIRPGEHVDVERLDRLPPDPPVEGVFPRAARRDPDATADNRSSVSSDRLGELGVDAVATEGETVTVTGRPTRFGSASSLHSGREPVLVHEITPPPRLEDGWATIWFTVDRDRFDDDPTRAHVARRTDDGWHVLATSLEQANDTTVVLRARTPGFSAFAVFEDPRVTYRWTFEGKGAVEAQDVAVTYEEAGVYTGTLEVTDARARSNSTTYRLLVNDRPDVAVDAPRSIEPGERVTLRADVTDEYGNTSVTWTFDDGTVVEGTVVTRAFDDGERAVTVAAEDEFGATGEASAQFAVGGPDPVVQVVEFALGVEGRLAIVVLLSLAIIGSLRWLVDRSGIGETRRSR